MWNQPYGKTDLESGARPLYPMMLESPELRWSFIRKVYSIIAIQLLVTIVIGAVVVSVRPIGVFFATTGAGLALYIVLIFVPFISASPDLIAFNSPLAFPLISLSRLCCVVFACNCSVVSTLLLLPEASRQLPTPRGFHYISFLCRWIELRLY